MWRRWTRCPRCAGADVVRGRGDRAADGYARIADKPAAVLLHLGPGLGNGLANLHNAAAPARRWSWSSATTPRTTRSTTHHWNPTSMRWRAPCLDGYAAARDTADVAVDAHAMPSRRPARLGPPDPAGRRVLDRRRAARRAPGHQTAGQTPASRRAVRRAAPRAALWPSRGPPDRRRCRPASRGSSAAARIAKATGARLLCETFPTRLERGAGVPPVETARVPREVRPHAAQRRQAPDPCRRRVAGVVLRVSKQAQQPRSRHATCTSSHVSALHPVGRTRRAEHHRRTPHR